MFGYSCLGPHIAVGGSNRFCGPGGAVRPRLNPLEGCRVLKPYHRTALSHVDPSPTTSATALVEVHQNGPRQDGAGETERRAGNPRAHHFPSTSFPPHALPSPYRMGRPRRGASHREAGRDDSRAARAMRGQLTAGRDALRDRAGEAGGPRGSRLAPLLARCPARPFVVRRRSHVLPRSRGGFPDDP